MGHGRLLWAAVMVTASVTILAGYTAAGALLPPQAGQRAQAAAAAASELSSAAVTSPEKPADALMVTVRDDTGASGRKVVVSNAVGTKLCLEAPNRLGELRLELSPEQSYTLTSEDGLSTTFYLEANGAVTNVTGDGWSDGELLHLDTEPRCTLEIRGVAAGAEAVCTLTGAGVEETRVLSTMEGEDMGRAVFAGLAPGTYDFSGCGVQRTVELTAEQPYVVLGLT